MTPNFELFLFACRPRLVREAERAGVDGFVIDWESFQKHERQRGADTEISGDTFEDLATARAATSRSVICRINPWDPRGPEEVEAALDGGADEVLLPMVRGPEEVEAALEAARGRCGVGILVETEEAVEHAHRLGRLPLTRAYVGLNDLAIARGSDSIFEAVSDGTVERVRAGFETPFGFAGLTLPERGRPIPCRLLIAEMARLDCSFSFLRRSYRRDVAPGRQAEAIEAIRAALRAAQARDPAAVESDRLSLRAAIGSSRRRVASGS